MKTMSLLVFLGLASVSWSASALVIKTEDQDVNLWVNPGKIGLETVDEIKPHEEVTVTGALKILPSGGKWYPVMIRRVENKRMVETRGWVDAQYFKPINSTAADGESEAGSKDTCPTCLSPTKKKIRLPVANVKPSTRSSKQGFIWPAVGRISSGFSAHRFHPVDKVDKPHNGIDLNGNRGKPVLAAKAGTVIKSDRRCRIGDRKCHTGAGNIIQIDHGGGVITEYFHLSGDCPVPKVGAKVKQGEQIACVGMTGTATGFHLHFGVKVGGIHGTYINPLSVLPRR